MGVGRMQSASFAGVLRSSMAKLLAHLAPPIKLVGAGNSKRADLHPPYGGGKWAIQAVTSYEMASNPRWLI